MAVEQIESDRRYMSETEKDLEVVGTSRMTMLQQNLDLLIIYYIADLPVTRLRLLTNKSDNIAVPYASLRSLILLLSSIELRFFSNT